MKLPALCLVVLMPAWFAAASAPAAAVDPNDIERLLDAIARIESHGDPNAVGDGGRALGVYQIHRVYWEDGHGTPGGSLGTVTHGALTCEVQQAVNDHEPAGRLLPFGTSGDAVPRPLGFIALRQRQDKRTRRRSIETTSPLPLGRGGARVASQQRPILRHGAASVSAMGAVLARAIPAAGHERPRRRFGSRGTCGAGG